MFFVCVCCWFTVAVVSSSSTTTTATYNQQDPTAFRERGFPGPNFPVLIFIFVIIEK
jgi:hypothetical protein